MCNANCFQRMLIYLPAISSSFLIMKHRFINYFILRVWPHSAASFQNYVQTVFLLPAMVAFCMFRLFEIRGGWWQLICVSCCPDECDFNFLVLALANAACFYFCFLFLPQGGTLFVHNRWSSKFYICSGPIEFDFRIFLYHTEESVSYNCEVCYLFPVF